MVLNRCRNPDDKKFQYYGKFNENQFQVYLDFIRKFQQQLKTSKNLIKYFELISSLAWITSKKSQHLQHFLSYFWSSHPEDILHIIKEGEAKLIENIQEEKEGSDTKYLVRPNCTYEIISREENNEWNPHESTYFIS